MLLQVSFADEIKELIQERDGLAAACATAQDAATNTQQQNRFAMQWMLIDMLITQVLVCSRDVSTWTCKLFASVQYSPEMHIDKHQIMLLNFRGSLGLCFARKAEVYQSQLQGAVSSSGSP